ncbi:MAG: aspartate--tRNA ligase [Candidatus Buchananbacteria bacterium]|nr:aspartate--tRNA ligase [Candidatus Buchananbacteria bacterium]
MLRTHTCGELSKKQIGQKVTLTGWVNTRRDHGGIIFIDLRDRYGLTQIKFDPDISKAAWDEADKVRPEWVLQVTGEVFARPKDMINPKMATGEIEVAIDEIKILNKSKTPPFEISQEKSVNEDLRLKYRYLDLRHPRLQKIMKQRDDLITYVREYFHKNNFIEIQTPILANSSPEGARDYLVPSRLYPGKFYALPQAPQQFKQLLMVGGMDKYFQIATCFRDEDPRADRHPGDFYQIDMEMSFVEQEDVWQTIEPLMIELTEKFSDKEVLQKPFPVITYKEVISKYGSDKPDLRFDFEIKDLSEEMQKTEFKVFTDALSNGGIVNALKIKDGAKFSRKHIDELTEIAKNKGAKGLAYIIYEKEIKSPILKFLSDPEIKAITKKTKAKEGDIVFFGADNWKIASEALGAVREECGAYLGLKDSSKAAWLWICDYPMYDYSEMEEGKIDFSHNPFSMPQGGLKALEEKDPLEILAYQYDLVCNGFEISSGAIRNHDPETMYKAFAVAGYTKEQVDAKFGHMIKAFEYGAPPHGGCAPGLDRLLMVFWECPSIRDIYAFPKNGAAQDVMLGAPSEVSDKQLEELHIKLDLDE